MFSIMLCSFERPAAERHQEVREKVKVGLPDVTRHAAQLPDPIRGTAKLFGELLERPQLGMEVIPSGGGEQRSQGFFTQE